ncbi:retrovirus-related Pol polyprotein from transposon gypsy [Trichonephila clavipes]|nr:retrovirus-related Pol polyprotein from transposon gypsy [Trichonephila clavipes]
MNYHNANNEDNINVKNNKGLDQISDSPEADLKRFVGGKIRSEYLPFRTPSHSPYAAPVTLAYKKDEGKRSRLCIDYRKLNEITRKDSTPVPLIDFVIDNLTHAKFFSTLDLTSGSWHIKIHEKDAEKLAFTTNFGLYEWLRLPFG